MGNREKLSVVIITKDEEENIEEALSSVSFADEIVVVDALSSDRTVEIARRFTDKVFLREWKGYVEQKNFALAKARFPWVLSLDADERVTPELAREIEEVLSARDKADGYFIPRRVFYLGRWIRYGGWYPDYQLRLARREKARFVGGSVHEVMRVEGKTERLSSFLLHFTYKDITEHIERMNLYTSLVAFDRKKEGRRPSLLKLIFSPPLSFIKGYIIKLGFLDGIPGFIIAFLSSCYTFLKEAKLFELYRSEKD
ncbi:MAG: glycosyltransferase family 2 protein [Acidobacteria bacterium]|nr:glycosyltransferase family 2 protein [Acidobacteriota bacterium]